MKIRDDWDAPGGYRVGDYCMTPTGRLAQVRGFVGDRLVLCYLTPKKEDAAPDEVTLLPSVCKRV